MSEPEIEFTGEDYAVMHERSKLRRAANRERSAQLLRERGLDFLERNAGAHLIVRHPKVIVDFWPGTGKWHSRAEDAAKGRGVKNMLAYLEKKA